MTARRTLPAAEARLRRIEAAMEAPSPRSPDVASDWVDELERLDAFTAGLLQGRAAALGGAQDILGVLGLLVAVADLGSLPSWVGLGLGWYAVFVGFAGGIQAERQVQQAMRLQGRIHDAMARLDRLA